MSATSTTTTCPRCKGAGDHDVTVAWSDGLGVTRQVCGLCLGKRTVPTGDELLRRWQVARDALAQKEAELAKLQVHVGLYLHTSHGTVPQPPYAAATGPAQDPKVWERYLEQAARDIPRVTSPEVLRHTAAHDAMRPDPCRAGWAMFVCPVCGSTKGGGSYPSVLTVGKYHLQRVHPDWRPESREPLAYNPGQHLDGTWRG